VNRGIRSPAWIRFAGSSAAGLILSISCWEARAQSRELPGQDARIVDEFAAKINAYLELQKDTAAPPLKPDNSPEKITSTRHAVSSKVSQARANNRQGEVFTPEIAVYFRKRLAAVLEGPDGERIKASLRRAEPVKNMKIHVNEPYPSGVPLQSTPPSLLLNLPILPTELEYRIVGDKLILRDAQANLVVDFIPHAFPPP